MDGTESLRLPGRGVTLHAVAAGPAEAPLVLLLHGFPEFWWGWRRQIGPLAAAGFRVVVPDLRGYNLSDKPRGVAAYALDEVAGDVAALAGSLGRERFAVVGHDWGAILTWHLATRAPDRVERAAVLNGPHTGTMGPFVRAHPAQALRSWYVGFFQMPLLPEAMLRVRDFAAMRGAMLGTARKGTFTEADFGRYREAWSQPGALTAMLNWYRALVRHGGTPRERIRVPLRVIWGERDTALDRGLVKAGLALCDRGDVHWIPDATHWVQHEAAERVNALLIEFLR